MSSDEIDTAPGDVIVLNHPGMDDPNPVYWCAFSCGHRTFWTPEFTAGMDWCYTCNSWVGVLVTRKR